jgi:hypothetical protein
MFTAPLSVWQLSGRPFRLLPYVPLHMTTLADSSLNRVYSNADPTVRCGFALRAASHIPVVPKCITSKDSITRQSNPKEGIHEDFAAQEHRRRCFQVDDLKTAACIPLLRDSLASTFQRLFTSSWRRRSCRIVDRWYRCADLVPASSSSVGDLCRSGIRMVR